MNIEAQLTETAARVSGSPPGLVPPELLTLLMDLLAGFMDSCLGNDPASLAKRIRNPNAFTIARLKREARKGATKNACGNPVATANQAVTTLLTFAQEHDEAELAQMIAEGRQEQPPLEWI